MTTVLPYTSSRAPSASRKIRLVFISNIRSFLPTEVRRTSFDEYRTQGRGGTGIKTMNCTDKTGKVVSATVVSEEDELMLMTTAGQSVRIKVATVRETGRATQGVKLMTLNDGEAIQDISIVIPDDEDEEGAEGAEDAEAGEDSGEAEAPAEE